MSGFPSSVVQVDSAVGRIYNDREVVGSSPMCVLKVMLLLVPIPRNFVYAIVANWELSIPALQISEALIFLVRAMVHLSVSFRNDLKSFLFLVQIRCDPLP